MDRLLTFEEVLNQTHKPFLLLGNGFSMAYDHKRFSFTTLLESAITEGIISENSEIYKVFQKLETADFESVMRILEDSEKIVGIYGGEKELQEKIMEDNKKLKEYLVKIITNNHPEKSTSLTIEEKESCISFLKNFSGIYTLNYDLLLYWATMQEQHANLVDGFGNNEESEHEGYVVYGGKAYKMNIFYLHGALHYFDAGDEIIKKTYVNTERPLVEQIRSSLDENKYPIFISEGNSEQKMTKIMHSAYLIHCYKSLRGIGSKKKKESSIVMFGVSLKENDSHILDAILKSNLKNIYIGVSSRDAVSHIEAKVEEHNRKTNDNKIVILYDYRTVDVWGKNESKKS